MDIHTHMPPYTDPSEMLALVANVSSGKIMILESMTPRCPPFLSISQALFQVDIPPCKNTPTCIVQRNSTLQQVLIPELSPCPTGGKVWRSTCIDKPHNRYIHNIRPHAAELEVSFYDEHLHSTNLLLCMQILLAGFVKRSQSIIVSDIWIPLSLSHQIPHYIQMTIPGAGMYIHGIHIHIAGKPLYENRQI